jgi:prepilin signal peptidase PulO-like enzyme (type II secretory pathway)
MCIIVQHKAASWDHFFRGASRLETVLPVVIFVVGLVVGSFYNVLAVRLLHKQSLLFPASHCPHCRRSLKPTELIPVLSYVFLRGKCSSCRERISVLYPLGELLTAVSFVLLYLRFGWSAEAVVGFVLVSVLILAVLTDLRRKLILDVVTLPAVGVLLFLRIWIGDEAFTHYLLGGVTGFLLLLLLAIISKGGTGGGDIKLYAAIGVALGPGLTVMSLILASFFGAVGGLLLILARKANRKAAIPFAPFIYVGTIATYLYHEPILAWYTGLMFG